MINDAFFEQPDIAIKDRRFGGISRLYGEEAAIRFQGANVCVVGVGGVGSWALEALARSGVGHLVAVDLDMIAESNTNRQIHALESQFGKAKVVAMAERILEINSQCKIDLIEDFITDDNLPEILTDQFDIVIDAIDQSAMKVAMIAHCKRIGVDIIVAGAAGGKSDPSEIKMADLALTVQDPLLAKVRAKLRRDYGFSRVTGKRFGVTAVYSTEPVRYPKQSGQCAIQSNLNCAGFGSSVCVTATFGMFAASAALAVIERRLR